MLVLDNLGCHVSPATQECLAQMNTHAVNPPVNCTDIVAPIDHHVGEWIKKRMARRYAAALSTNWDVWRTASENDNLSATRRRQFMAEWLDEALEELYAPANEKFLRSSFESTGILIKRDGTNNIKIRGGEDYKFT